MAPVGSVYIEDYSGRENFINQSFILLGENGEQTELAADEHIFDIVYELPANLPTSFKCKLGSIKYKLFVTVERHRKKKAKFDFPFTVIRPLDLNKEGDFIKNPMKDELTKNFKMDFTSEPLYMSASIPFGGYVPGQTMNVMVEINNQSKTHVKEIKISLKKIVTLISQKPRKKTFELIISEAKISADAVPILTMQMFEKRLVVPSLPPNILNCDAIHVQYELRVKAITGGLSRSPKLKLPITIGTSPLANIPQSLSRVSLLPPSYEESMRDADSSDGEGAVNPRYPVFEFEDDDESYAGNRL